MEKQQNELIKEVVKEVAKDVYNDGVQPAVRETGQILALIPRTIRAALLNVEKWIIDKENKRDLYNFTETKKLLEDKLQNTDPEQIVPIDAYIAVPALQYISYCQDSDELRNMYANLLAKSMHETARSGVHPAFVEIIKQLCSDEAKILHIIDNDIPVVALLFKNSIGESVEVVRGFSDIGEKAGCEYPENIQSYLDNFERLGLIVPLQMTVFSDDAAYELIKKHSLFIKMVEQYASEADEGYEPRMQNRGFSFTHFGQVFRKICIDSNIN